MSGWIRQKCSQKSSTNWSLAARKRLARLGSTSSTDEGLLNFIPRVTPRWESPVHLAPIAEAIERALTESVRVLISVPPQHGKTETVKHGLAWYMRQRPRSRNAFISYAAQKSESESQATQWIAESAGLDPEGSRKSWRCSNGAQLVAPGIGGPLTGYGIDGIAVVDDPHKDRREAESATQRRHVMDWFQSVLMTRLHPGASVLVVHTRWHPDDLIGQLAKRDGWEVINLPAINEDGEALWPAHRPLDFLQDQRAEVSEYEWASLYMGEPRPRGGAVFREPAYYGPGEAYESLPEVGADAHGTDLAYTAKTYADYSVVVTLRRVGSLYYIVDVVRKQCEATVFCGVLERQARRYPGRVVWHAAGTEKGAAQFIKARVPLFEVKNATTDKFVRAQPVAAAWNDGRVLLPRDAPWLDTFLTEVLSFTGVGDKNDDQVDALSSAFSALQAGRPRQVRNLPAF